MRSIAAAEIVIGERPARRELAAGAGRASRRLSAVRRSPRISASTPSRVHASAFPGSKAAAAASAAVGIGARRLLRGRQLQAEIRIARREAHGARHRFGVRPRGKGGPPKPGAAASKRAKVPAGSMPYAGMADLGFVERGAPGIAWTHTRGEVARMTPFEAKDAGTMAEANMRKMGIDWVTFEGRRMPYRSKEKAAHYRLIVAAKRAKLEQNPGVRDRGLDLNPDERPIEEAGFQAARALLDRVIAHGCVLDYGWVDRDGVKVATVRGPIPVALVLAQVSGSVAHIPRINMPEVGPDAIRVVGFALEVAPSPIGCASGGGSMALICRRPCGSGSERNMASGRHGQSSPSSQTAMRVSGGVFRQSRDPQRDATLETGVDQVALPGLAVRHDGDANVGGFGAGGAPAALLGGKIDADAHGVSPRAVRCAQGGRMPAGRQAGRQFAVHLPAIAAGVLQEDGMRAVGADAREHIGAREVRARALEPDRHVIVVVPENLAVARGGVLDRGQIGRRLPRILDFRPMAVAGDVRAMVQHAFQLHAGEPGGAAHGQQAGGIRPHPVVELAAQLVVS
jgi:hypothetical protein